MSTWQSFNFQGGTFQGMAIPGTNKIKADCRVKPEVGGKTKKDWGSGEIAPLVQKLNLFCF